MTPEQFRQLAQQNIFPGESGGDYNALFGYQNRDGGRYAGTRLTDMTVNQALEFSKPSGDYGQHVKGLIGRVATPMGAYQVVGTTLRGARDAMGLTGNEVMTPEMQDRIGAHIYQTQGSGAWEGWGKGGGRGSAPQSSRAPAQAQPVSYSTRGAPEMAQQQAPQGILGALGLQKRDEAAGGQTAMPFGQRDNFKDLMGNLAMGFNSMRLNPDANLAQNVQGQRDGRRDAQQKNRTIEWLRSQPGGEQFAAMAEAAGVGPALAAYQQSMQAPDRTSGQQNYEFMIANGIAPDQAMERAFGAGGVSVTNNMPAGANEFEEAFAKDDASAVSAISAAGLAAQRNIGRIDQLEGLLAQSGTGAGANLKLAAGEYGINTDGLSEIQAAQALINSLVPEQRQPGSGPMSDADLALFKQSLPRIINQPGGNTMIINTMKAIAQYDAEGAQIVQRMRLGPNDPQYLDRSRAFQALQGRANPMDGFAAPAPSGASPAPAGSTRRRFNEKTGAFE
jgi:flagellar protein FlgJ